MYILNRNTYSKKTLSEKKSFSAVFKLPNTKHRFFLFRYDHTDFFGSYQSGLEFKGPLWDPIRVCANLVSFSTFVVVPIFYYAIFMFRRAQDQHPGKRERKHHKAFKEDASMSAAV